MDNEQVPERRVTVSQVVAYNLARWRKAAGLTQAGLGKSLGWSYATASAAERSWDGKRIRKVTGDEIVAIAGALGVPLAAMFLPPDDDGATVRYVLPNGAGMAQLFNILLLETADTAEPDLDEAWRDAIEISVARYASAEVGAEILANRGDVTDEARRTVWRDRLRWQREAMLAVVADLDAHAAALEEEWP